MLNKKNNSIEISFNRLDNTKINIVFFSFNLPNDVILPQNTIIFQSEDLTDTESWMLQGERGKKYFQLLEDYPFIDYSKANLNMVQNSRKTYLPFLYCDKLKSTFERNPSNYFLFYGALTDYRKEVINNLNQFSIKCLGANNYWNYGFYRDKLLLESIGLLNIHKTQNIKKFESIRCFLSLINEVPFITETFQFDANDYYYDCIHVVDNFTNLEIGKLKKDLTSISINRQKFELFKSYNAFKIFQEALSGLQL